MQVVNNELYMNKLVFATNNKYKLEEVKSVVADQFQILNLKDIDCRDELPETAETLEGNALMKAQFLYDKYGLNCFADDTGLEVEALGGRPGVYSARYAGAENDAQKNMDKLLGELQATINRKARFRTVVALIEQGKPTYFEGVVEGQITEQKSGNTGFGYDPIFIPNGYTQTFAELGDDIKNKISHRALAIQKLSEYLKQEIKR